MWVWVWVHVSSMSYCRMMVHYWLSPRVNPPPHPTTLCPFLHSLLVLPSPYIPLPLPGLWLLSSRSPPPSLLPSSLPHSLTAQQKDEDKAPILTRLNCAAGTDAQQTHPIAMRCIACLLHVCVCVCTHPAGLSQMCEGKYKMAAHHFLQARMEHCDIPDVSPTGTPTT